VKGEWGAVFRQSQPTKVENRSEKWGKYQRRWSCNDRLMQVEKRGRLEEEKGVTVCVSGGFRVAFVFTGLRVKAVPVFPNPNGPLRE